MADSRCWHARFMGLCDQVSEWSEDPHFRVGCVIVDARHVVLATGYNGFPRGVQGNDSRRFDRESGEKFFWFEHAERNAIYNAASVGVPLSGATLYVNRFPCADCSRAIIQSGIGALVCPPIPEVDGALDDSFRAGAKMLEEAGLPVTVFSRAKGKE